MEMIAGDPDAADWDKIVTSQNKVIKNNNQQYKINEALMNTSKQILQEYNEIVQHLSENSKGELQQATFNRLGIIKEELKEIVRAAQLAKRGIVNTNLLDKEEVGHILAEVETLPYSTEIEAIEYAEPKMVAKGSTILYVMSIPKTNNKEYNRVAVRSTARNNRQVYVEYRELFVNQEEIFGITDRCYIFKDTTICRSNQLVELPRDHCISQLLKGQHAGCDYQFNQNEEVETLNDNTIFLNNFKGEVTQNNTSRHLSGSFLIQIHNETIEINNNTFSAKELKTLQILPSVLQGNITERGTKLDLKYLHNLHLSNVRKLRKLFSNDQITTITDIATITVIVIVLIFLISKFRKRRQEHVLWPKMVTNTQETNAIPNLQPISLNF